MRIKFVTRHVVKQGDGKGPVYETGSEHDFDGPVAETYARKYIRRGWAEEVVQPPPIVSAEIDPLLDAVYVTKFADADAIDWSDAEPKSATVADLPVSDRRVVHAGRGRWNVIDADGNKTNDTPLSREEADALAAEPGKE